MKKPLIFIAGPTASGKTQISVSLAKKINGEIISADSMQIYKKMDIGTAKVTTEEMQGVKHYMIDELDPRTSCDVAYFKEKVKQIIQNIHEKGKTPIIVGGTGFYINAILYDTQFEETKVDETYRTKLSQMFTTYGKEYLYTQLQQIDPESAKTIHPNNIKRVMRALEYYHQTGTLFSSHNQQEKQKRQNKISPYDFCFFVLTMDRKTLYERIHQRIDQMVGNGLVEEVKYFFDNGYEKNLPSMQAIGYKEFFPYFEGKCSLQECMDELNKNTRHYAKRQLTWFRNQTDPIFIPVDAFGFDANKIVAEMIKDITEQTNISKNKNV